MCCTWDDRGWQIGLWHSSRGGGLPGGGPGRRPAGSAPVPMHEAYGSSRTSYAPGKLIPGPVHRTPGRWGLPLPPWAFRRQERATPPRCVMATGEQPPSLGTHLPRTPRSLSLYTWWAFLSRDFGLWCCHGVMRGCVQLPNTRGRNKQYR